MSWQTVVVVSLLAVLLITCSPPKQLHGALAVIEVSVGGETLRSECPAAFDLGFDVGFAFAECEPEVFDRQTPAHARPLIQYHNTVSLGSRVFSHCSVSAIGHRTLRRAALTMVVYECLQRPPATMVEHRMASYKEWLKINKLESPAPELQ